MNRRWHRWLALATALPFAIVAITGCLLQFKRMFPFLQPESRTSAGTPFAQGNAPVPWESLLAAARSVPEAGIAEWKDVKVVDVRPALGVARLRSQGSFEVQVDLADGKVLSAGPRRASAILEIHEGSFFGPWIREWVFSASAMATLGMTATGLVMLFRYYFRKWRRACSIA